MPMSIAKPLGPGISSMRRWRMSVKLGLMGLLLVVPLAATTVSQYRSLSAEIAISQIDAAAAPAPAVAAVASEPVARAPRLKAA